MRITIYEIIQYSSTFQQYFNPIAGLKGKICKQEFTFTLPNIKHLTFTKHELQIKTTENPFL